ncbi:MAG: heavy-metal-associated domain-containing protein [Gammaproteobacteria bacterium]|nr:heavy-metal-associated domain-containing protein [Gammaproteobacteria bacterium]MCF6261400.1 heavy-metal-associated domain-containing protein [Gammaproteobacteria bacterium]
MKKITLFFAGLLLLPLSAFSVNAANGQVVEIGVTGMVCEFCVNSVEKGLKKLPGVKQVKVSLEDKRAEIVMADDTTIDAAVFETQVRKIIEDAGFTPGELQVH